jgi:hypothetical protein
VRRLRIDKEMSRRLGECRPQLSRDAMVRFRVGLRDDLENRYHLYRSRRHPADQRFFPYSLPVADGALLHRFAFVIDDSTSPDDLFLIDFKHRCGPA